MESAAANHIVVEFLIFIKLKLYNFGGNDILLECERERLIMDIMLNRLFTAYNGAVSHFGFSDAFYI